MKTDVKPRRVKKRVKRERWVLRSVKLKKESDPNNDSLLLCEDDVEEVSTVMLAEKASEEKEFHHGGNSCLEEAQNLTSVKERWAVKSLKLEKEKDCRVRCPGHTKEEDTDVEEVGVIYLGEVEESDVSTSPQQPDYMQSPGENLWESDLEINIS